MSHKIKISEPKQIEYNSTIEKIMEENPDLSYNMIKQLLLARQEVLAGEVSKYKFDT